MVGEVVMGEDGVVREEGVEEVVVLSQTALLSCTGAPPAPVAGFRRPGAGAASSSCSVGGREVHRYLLLLHHHVRAHTAP